VEAARPCCLHASRNPPQGLQGLGAAKAGRLLLPAVIKDPHCRQQFNQLPQGPCSPPCEARRSNPCHDIATTSYDIVTTSLEFEAQGSWRRCARHICHRGFFEQVFFSRIRGCFGRAIQRLSLYLSPRSLSLSHSLSLSLSHWLLSAGCWLLRPRRVEQMTPKEDFHL